MYVKVKINNKIINFLKYGKNKKKWNKMKFGETWPKLYKT